MRKINFFKAQRNRPSKVLPRRTRQADRSQDDPRPSTKGFAKAGTFVTNCLATAGINVQE